MNAAPISAVKHSPWTDTDILDRRGEEKGKDRKGKDMEAEERREKRVTNIGFIYCMVHTSQR